MKNRQLRIIRVFFKRSLIRWVHSHTHTKNGHIKGVAIFGALCLFAIFVAGVMYFTPSTICKILGDEFSRQNAGAYGDQFGIANAVFSGVALSFVGATLFLQSHELKLQRDELKKTKFVLDDQKKQMAKQAESLSKTAFENSFYELVRILSDKNQELKELLCDEVDLIDRNANEIFKRLHDKNQVRSGSIKKAADFIDRELPAFGYCIDHKFGPGLNLISDDELRRVCATCAYKLRFDHSGDWIHQIVSLFELCIQHVIDYHLMKVDDPITDTHKKYARVLTANVSRELHWIVALHCDVGWAYNLSFWCRRLCIFESYFGKSRVGADHYMTSPSFDEQHGTVIDVGRSL